MDNVYQAPKTGAGPEDIRPGEFGSFDLGRAFQLAFSAYRDQVGLGVGIILLSAVVIVGFTLTCVGILFAVPQVVAALPVVGYLMIRRGATSGDVFLGFRSYGSVLLAFILLGVVNYALTLPFSLPQMMHYYGDFPFAELGRPDSTSIIGEWVQRLASKNRDPFSGAALGRMLVGYLSYPIMFYLAGRFHLVYPLIMIRRMSAIEALKTSWAITGPYQWWLLLLHFIAGILSMSGVVLCGVGVLFTLPLGLVLQGAATFQLFGEDQARQRPAVE